MSNNKFDIEVNTIIDKEGVITQTVGDKFNDVRTEYYRLVLATQEEEIKKALIKLGWTPPT